MFVTATAVFSLEDAFMKLVKCPICGESYSDTYKACPFCAESGPYEGTVKPRKAKGRRIERRRGPNILGPALILVLLLLAALLAYTYYGDEIRAWFNRDKEPEPEIHLSVEPTSVELAVGEIRLLTASGAEKFVWSSSDEAVATVDEQGSVTAMGVGTADITVKDAAGEHSAQCKVTVKEAEPPEGPGDNTEPDPGPVNPPATDLKLIAKENRNLPTISFGGETIYDVTLRKGSTLHFSVSGTDSTVTWASDNAAVTVDAEGTVKRVSSGTAIITATVDGQTLKCRILG